MKNSPSLICLMLCFHLVMLNGQPGTLNTTFANNGIFTLDITEEDEIQDLALLSDGSIIAVGYVDDQSYDGVIMRISGTGQLIWTKQIDINGNFSLDQFNGIVVRNDEIFVQANYYNDASSKFEINILKFDIDGNRITDFGVNGKAIAVLGNGLLGFEMYGDDSGNLYVVGRTYFFNSQMEDGLVVKFKANGSLDESFGENGIRTIGIGDLRTGFLEGMLIDNEFYAVGWYLNNADGNALSQNGIVIKLKADGSLDTDFGHNGNIHFNKSLDDLIEDIVRHGDDHFLIGISSGTSSDDIYVMRYSLDGNLDLNFGSKGIVQLDYGSDDDAAELLVRRDLGIYICASINSVEDFALISLNADGSSDTAFGTNGKIVLNIKNNDNVSEGLIMPNGDVLLGGESDESNDGDFAIVRITGYPTCSDKEKTMNISGCEMAEFDGTIYKQTGNFNLVYQTEKGCDSIIHLNVIIKPESKETISLNSCGPAIVNDETYNVSGTYTQNLTASNGCDSILTVNVDIKSTTQETISVNSCGAAIVNDQTYNVSGTYTQNLTASNGCDSILTVNVGIEVLDASITEDENGMLVSSSEANQYQWYNCSTGTPVSGETNNAFSPTETGEYALIIGSEMCADTSNCISITISGIDDFSALSAISLFPNPGHSFISIKGIELYKISSINLYNLSGQSLPTKIQEISHGIRITVDHLASGLYYIQILDKTGHQKVLSFVKE